MALEPGKPQREYWVAGFDRWEQYKYRCQENNQDELLTFFSFIHSFSIENAGSFGGVFVSGFAILVMRGLVRREISQH